MQFAGFWKEKKSLEIKRPSNILIVKLSAIGDVVHTLPLLEVLRKNFPGARIDWLVEEEAGQIIDGHRGIDHVIVSRRKSWQRRLFKVMKQSAVLGEVNRFLRELIFFPNILMQPLVEIEMPNKGGCSKRRTVK